jgi:hypothetical protein
MAVDEARCIELLSHSKIKVHDKGTNVSAVFLNPERRIVQRIRMDGCMVPAGQTAVEFLEHRRKIQKKPPNSPLTSILIVCSEFPSKNPRIQRKRDTLGKRGFHLLVSTHNGGELSFSTFLGAKL